MKLRPLLFACVILAGCGSRAQDENVPPAASFSDATTDTGKKDTGSQPTDALADTSLLADASDVMNETPACVGTCIGAEMPAWQLEDFQPKSPGFRKTYGLSAFKGKVTVVALLSGW